MFDDDAARADLNAVIHPLVARRSTELMAAAAPDAVVVYEVPLLAETGRGGEFDAVVVVEAALDRRLARLADRGLPEAQARSRIAAQATDEQRRAIADEVVVNDSDRDDLARAVRALWERLLLRRYRRGGIGRRSEPGESLVWVAVAGSAKVVSGAPSAWHWSRRMRT